MIFALKMSVLNFLQFQSFEYTQVDFNLDTFAFIWHDSKTNFLTRLLEPISDSVCLFKLTFIGISVIVMY